MIGGYKLLELVENEIIERKEEGCVVPDFGENLGDKSHEELEKIYDELDALKVSEDFPYTEPEHLVKPLNDTLYSSILGFHPASIKDCAERTYKLFVNKEI